jgi:osmoprotectant transport system substrate-binding protein
MRAAAGVRRPLAYPALVLTLLECLARSGRGRWNKSFITGALAGWRCVRAFFAANAIALILLSAPAGAQEAVRVASKLDPESALLGNLILVALDAQGIKTIDKLQLGPTNILRRAILSGEIDIYPEYTGNGAVFHSAESDPVWKNAAAGYARIRALDRPLGLVWLEAAPADNSWVIVVRRDVAARHRLASMVDLAAWVRSGGDIKLAASAEFVESPAALPAFERTYDFKLSPSSLIVLAGGDTAVTIRAAAEGISGVDAAMAYGTDGALAVLDLLVLADPQGAQAIYAPAPVIRAAVLDRLPGIAAALSPIFRSLDEATWRRLNASIAVDGMAARVVAAEHLRSLGLLR